MRVLTTLTLLLLTALPAAAQTTYVLQGLPGDPGPPGADGAASPLDCQGNDCTVPGDLTVAGTIGAVDATVAGLVTGASNTVIDDLQADGAAVVPGTLDATAMVVTGSYDLAECPSGYSLRFGGICELEVSPKVYDEMVPVGDFWIDRYEISLWEDPGCATVQRGVSGDDLDKAGFPDTGNWTGSLYACSLFDVTPSGYVTWYQAQQACALAGKELCTSAQWQAAAAGTVDSQCNEGLECKGPDPWPTGDLMCGGCESTWGGVDMVGNLWEYIAEWQGHPGWNGALNVMTTDFGEDGYWAGGPDYDSNLDFSNDGSWRARCPAFAGEGDEIGDYYGPAAVRRGGHAVYGYGGVFAQAVGNGPSRPHSSYGTRCCIDR